MLPGEKGSSRFLSRAQKLNTDTSPHNPVWQSLNGEDPFSLTKSREMGQDDWTREKLELHCILMVPLLCPFFLWCSGSSTWSDRSLDLCFINLLLCVLWVVLGQQPDVLYLELKSSQRTEMYWTTILIVNKIPLERTSIKYSVSAAFFCIISGLLQWALFTVVCHFKAALINIFLWTVPQKSY